MPRELRLDVALFVAGGLAILRAIRDQDYDVWHAPADRLATAKQLGCLCRLLVADARGIARHGARGDELAICRPATRIASGSPAARLRASTIRFCCCPSRKRLAMCALYAFLRRTDDLGDSPATVAERRERAGSLATVAGRGRCDGAATTIRCCRPWPTRSRRFDVPLAHLDAVIDGVEMDLEPSRYDTFEQLETVLPSRGLGRGTGVPADLGLPQRATPSSRPGSAAWPFS